MLRLKELRQKKGLTQGKLAEKIGVSRSAISMYEIDASEPDLDTLNIIANFFNVSIDYLTGRDEVDTQPQIVQPPEENTIRIVGRGGTIKEYKITDKERKMLEAMLEAEEDDPDLKY